MAAGLVVFTPERHQAKHGFAQHHFVRFMVAQSNRREIAGILRRFIVERRDRPVEIDPEKFGLRRVEIGTHGLGAFGREMGQMNKL